VYSDYIDSSFSNTTAIRNIQDNIASPIQTPYKIHLINNNHQTVFYIGQLCNLFFFCCILLALYLVKKKSFNNNFLKLTQFSRNNQCIFNEKFICFLLHYYCLFMLHVFFNVLHDIFLLIFSNFCCLCWFFLHRDLFIFVWLFIMKIKQNRSFKINNSFILIICNICSRLKSMFCVLQK
jgi:hypothetical protein